MKDNWIDILPPIPPAETLPAWLWLSIGVFIILVPILYIWYQSSQQQSLRKLKKLRAQLANNNDIQNIPFVVSKTIKQRFSVNNIEHVAIRDIKGWMAYKQRLLTGCFSKHQLQPSEINNLIVEAAYWIKQEKSE